MPMLLPMLLQMINVLADFKYGVTRWIIAHANVGVAWLFNVSCSQLRSGDAGHDASHG
jgi:hypothetical protein